MDKFTIKHNELSAEEFILLWESVWGQAPSLEQTKLAMEHTLFRVSVFDEDKIVAMARVIGDMGLCYYIKDVIVNRLLFSSITYIITQDSKQDSKQVGGRK